MYKVRKEKQTKAYIQKGDDPCKSLWGRKLVFQYFGYESLEEVTFDSALSCIRMVLYLLLRQAEFHKSLIWQLNLLVATKVGEEGLDIQTCCLVIRFDLPETVASFIQSRGRARMPRSEYAFLVDR